MMTSDRKAKMAARDRMADTGEPYSRARRAAGKSWPRLLGELAFRGAGRASRVRPVGAARHRQGRFDGGR
jgi:hypothetical protein